MSNIHSRHVLHVLAASHSHEASCPGHGGDRHGWVWAGKGRWKCSETLDEFDSEEQFGRRHITCVSFMFPPPKFIHFYLDRTLQSSSFGIFV
jgi:hypothetical protein